MERVFIYMIPMAKYLDGCCGALISNLGHRNRRSSKRIKAQYDKIEFAHPHAWKCGIV